ncbi:putative efflux protein, MATE family [Gracilibacillus ureilyticus]|uniref:Putative efflux protein, MATE family n=1 Tax=Gracilibacillus ureilyticus TaxID=531814 RepID=A0A1H9MWJ1_9BACI|nr:MATE family efflux transporter [Gracilibacillus ureilyticus]SER27887.1 putative efflux protein, MATE family [Gracilibacillus ureilyticus]
MRQRDFTKGKIWLDLFYFSSPIMLSNLLQVSYQFIDSLWVGNLLGAEALGAVAVSGTVIFTVLSFIIGINNTTLTILSQQKGKGNEQSLASYVNAFIVTLTVLAIVMGIFGFGFAVPILHLLGTPDSMMGEATSYLRINAAGILFLVGYNFISTVLRAMGDSKTPLIFVTIAVILNIILDPLLISVFQMGIEGAAWATVLSQGFSFLYGVSYMIRKELVPLTWPRKPDWREVKLILNLGIPSGLQMAVISAGSAAIMSVVTSFGSSVVAGYSAAQRLDSLFLLPAHALSAAVNSMAGQNIGIKQWDRVKKIAVYATVYNAVIMLIFAGLIVLFADFGIRLFVKEQEAVSFGAKYLMIIAFFYPFLGINFVLNGIVRASGAMYQVLILNLLSFWVLRYPLSFLFSKWLGENGIAYGIGVSFIVSSIIAYLYYRFGKWRSKQIFREQVEK